MTIAKLRLKYHQSICREVLGLRKKTPNIADKGSKSSIEISRNLVKKLGHPLCLKPPKAQTTGALFSQKTAEFLDASFKLLQHLRPGDWTFSTSQIGLGIAAFDQYEHLSALDELVKRLQDDPSLSTALSGDYLVTPDIVISREPISDADINESEVIINSEDRASSLTPLRSRNSPSPRKLLHASISCKWTIRSDRAQNTRTEALNLIRNRKGKTPHIVAVTAEPMPTRLSSIAMGTGDIDCVYHMALHELVDSVKELKNADQMEVLDMLIQGRRLRDISDLPFDLAI